MSSYLTFDTLGLKMSISEQNQRSEQEALTEKGKEVLAFCMKSLQTFGILDTLTEINKTLLDNRGEMGRQSRVDTQETRNLSRRDQTVLVSTSRVAVASVSLSWEANKKSVPLKIVASVAKTVDSTKPFQLTINYRENELASVDYPLFSTSFDDPTANPLTRDGDVPRWDVRGLADLDDNLGYFISREDLKRGIQERLDRACAYLTEQGLTKPVEI